MKLEQGKYYRTRDGRKAFVGAVDVPFNSKDNALGCIEGYGSTTWKANGWWGERGESREDLVAEWTEPRTWTREVTVIRYDNGEMACFMTIGSVTPWNGKVISRKEVTLVEGEGV